MENFLKDFFGTKRLDRLFFEIMAKQEVFDETVLVLARARMATWLQDNSCGLLDKQEGQPFLLNLLQCLARLMKDADAEIIEEYKTGVPLGILNPIIRQPRCFEE